jgi:hypothetical protein
MRKTLKEGDLISAIGHSLFDDFDTFEITYIQSNHIFCRRLSDSIVMAVFTDQIGKIL